MLRLRSATASSGSLDSSGLKECNDNNGSKHQADDCGIDDADNFDGLAVFEIVKSKSLEHGRETVAHVKPNHNGEQQITDGNMWYLELLTRLLVKVEIAVHEADFHEIKIHEMRDETC